LLPLKNIFGILSAQATLEAFKTLFRDQLVLHYTHVESVMVE
jgi:hypothetical protein